MKTAERSDRRNQKQNWKTHSDKNAGCKLGSIVYCWMRKSKSQSGPQIHVRY